MGWRDLLSMRWDGGLEVRANWLLLAIGVAFSIVAVLRVVTGLRRNYSAVEVNIPLAGQGAITLRRTDEVVRIAHEAWTEIVTRKAGLAFDRDNDLISEVYDSWYELFKELRSLTRSVPGETLRRSEDARRLVDILVDVLNTALRPHLTTHQARLRRWLERQRQHDDDRDPQEIERSYPKYEALVSDLDTIHMQLVAFAGELHLLAHGSRPS